MNDDDLDDFGGFEEDLYNEEPVESDEDEDEEEEEDADEEGEDEDEDESREFDPDGQDDAEIEINNDFSRLVRNMHMSDLHAGVGPDGRSGFSNSVVTNSLEIPIEEDLEATFRDDLRVASGIGRLKSKKKKRRPRNEPILSPEVKTLIGKGSQAYVDQQVDLAINTMQEVIRIEPRAASAWSILIACYRDLGQMEKVLQLGIMSAHLNGDYAQWFKLGDESKERGFVNQALYCYRKASILDPTIPDADWERAVLAKGIGDLRTAKIAHMSILRRFPHDTTVLAELRPVLIELSELPLCLKLYAEAFEHYQRLVPNGGSTTEDGGLLSGGGFDEFHVYVLADLYNTLGDYDKAIHTIRSGVRWLQGRADQKMWDTVSDDREYDVEGTMRSTNGEDNETVQPGFFKLDVNARHRIAIARLKLGEIDEAKIHTKVILSCNMLEYAPLFQEIADAYFENELYNLALPLYEDLASEEQTSNFHVLVQTAICRRNLNDLKGAAEVYEHTIATWPENSDLKMKLAEVYETMGDPKKALSLVYQVIDARKRAKMGKQAGSQPSTSTPQPDTDITRSLFDEKAAAAKKGGKPGQQLSPAEVKALEQERQVKLDAAYEMCKQLYDGMMANDKEAESEWLIEAEKLVEHFRETRQLFVTAKSSTFSRLRPSKLGDKGKGKAKESDEVDDVASRLQLEIEYETPRKEKPLILVQEGKLTVFRGINIDEWLSLILQYAFVLTKRGLYGIGSEVLRHIRLSVVFQDVEHQDVLRLALIACAMHIRDHETIMEQCRALINVHQFNNEPLRLLLVALGNGLHATETLITPNFQKHMYRELKMSDAIAHGKEIKWNSARSRYVLAEEKEEKDDEVDEDTRIAASKKSNESKSKPRTPTLRKPTKPNPFHLSLYGMICTAAKSYQSGLFYLLQCYELHQDDPITCLTLGVACLGRAMQRQADNRLFMITQGFAFLSRYRTLRGGDANDVDEVDYNFGRAFQQLGLHTYAVKHYEKVLQSAEERLVSGSQDYGLAREAAYNLSIIFVTTGAAKLAEQLYRRWLSV